MSPSIFMDNPFTAGINEIRSYWSRFLALGIIFMALGVVCMDGAWHIALATQLHKIPKLAVYKPKAA